MGGFYDRLSGLLLEFNTPAEQWAARQARMRRAVWLGVKMMGEKMQAAGGRLVMFTLTYASAADWAPRHISGFVRWLRRQNVRHYVWVAELQKRGAVHYHVLALLSSGQRWRKPSAKEGGWSLGFTWVTDEIKRPFYIMKYLQKGDPSGQKTLFPKGLRLYAVSQANVRSSTFETALAWRASHLPAWAGCDTKDACFVLGSRRVRGGVSYSDTIEFSPYSRAALPDLEWIGYKMSTAWRGVVDCPQQ